MWNAKSSKFDDKSLSTDRDTLLERIAPLLKDACENYLPYLERNALALESGTQRFDIDIEGYCYPKVHVSPYRDWCRERLYRHYSELSDEHQSKLRALTEPLGSLDSLLSHAHIESNWDPNNEAPLCRAGKVPLKEKMLARFTGTNHVRSRRLWKMS